MLSVAMNSEINVQTNESIMSHPVIMELLYCIWNEIKIITSGNYLIAPHQLYKSTHYVVTLFFYFIAFLFSSPLCVYLTVNEG